MFYWRNIQENISTNTVGIEFSILFSVTDLVFIELYGYSCLLLLYNMKQMYYVLEEEKTVKNL